MMSDGDAKDNRFLLSWFCEVAGFAVPRKKLLASRRDICSQI